MKPLIFGTLIAILYASCRTTSKNTPVKNDNPMVHTEIFCEIPSGKSKKDAIAVTARFSESETLISHITIKTPSKKDPQTFETSVTDGALVRLMIDKERSAQITLDEKPRVKLLTETAAEAAQESTEIPCLKLMKNTREAMIKPATCNAIGTPAAGWYQNGRALARTVNCANEALSCGVAPVAGWYVHTKTKKILAKRESCGWIRETPQCKSGNLGTGWYLNDRLLTRDDECVHKNIECNPTGRQSEGWYVYERSKPRLLIEGSCEPSREISYLAR